MKPILIVDYGLANLRSVQKAFEKVGAAAVISDDPHRIADADKLVLPGVGAFRDAIAKLREAGFVDPIKDHIHSGKPFLGICLGFQLLFTTSYEEGVYPGLDIFPGEVVRFDAIPGLKVPHMGWNQLRIRKAAPIFRDLPSDPSVYFVHGYYVKPSDASIIATETDYPTPFTSAIWHENVVATQFHPEKSQRIGLTMLKNFAAWWGLVDNMQIYPAIDLRAGKCVRLKQGDYAQETVFGADPAAMAERWVSEGATYLHLVDLDGAKQGAPVNGRSIRAIVKAANVPCQLGGGLRTEADIKDALDWGVTRVIVGTKALQSPTWLAKMSHQFPGRIVLGIDAKDGNVATDGWLEVSAMTALDLARHCAKPPLSAIIYTDISRDGMMQGANVPAMKEMAAAVPVPVIASGGVTTLDDVAHLQEAGLAGAIIGRALYEGSLSLREVLAQISGK